MHTLLAGPAGSVLEQPNPRPRVPLRLRLRYEAARATFSLVRVKTFSRARRVFRSVPSPCWLSRPMFGHDFHVDVSRSSTNQLIYLTGERFVPEKYLISALLRPGMRVVEVGSNIGYYLLMLERCVGPTGEIVCIEPSVENLAELRANIERNGFRNVRLEVVAVGSEDGVTGLKAGINSGVVEVGHGAYEVPLRRLYTLLDGPVDLVKIDVEGYEGHVIRGGAGVLRRHRPTLFVEIHPELACRFGIGPTEILRDLAACYSVVEGYETVPLGNPLARVLDRYASHRVARIADLPAYVASSERTPGHHTYWLVCR